MKTKSFDYKVAFAVRRLTARSWRFARRKAKANIFTKWFFFYVLGLLRHP